MSYMNEAMDEVGKRENREYRIQGDETLVRSRYLWLYAQEHLLPKHQERSAGLRSMNLKTGRAWANCPRGISEDRFSYPSVNGSFTRAKPLARRGEAQARERCTWPPGSYLRAAP